MLAITITLFLYNISQHIFCKNQMVNSLGCVSHTVYVATKQAANWINQWAIVSQLHLLYGGFSTLAPLIFGDGDFFVMDCCPGGHGITQCLSAPLTSTRLM